MIVACARCRRRHQLPELPARCPACRAPDPVEDEEAELPPVELRFAPRLDDAALAGALARWIDPVPCPPPGLEPALILASGARAWWPQWLADVELRGRWSAEVGIEEVVESAVEELRGGRWQRRSVRRKELRWLPRLGRIDRHHAKLPLPAVELPPGWGLGSPDETQVEAAPGEPVLLPTQDDVSREQALKAAMREAVSADVSRATGALRLRGLEAELEPPSPRWTLALRPVWVGQWGEEPVLVDLLSGAVAGRRWGDPRIARGRMRRSAALAAGLGLLAAGSAAVGLLLPPLLVLAVLLAGLALAALGHGWRTLSRLSAFNADEAEAWRAWDHPPGRPG